MAIETVLPSGRFARIERATGAHLLQAMRAPEIKQDISFTLITLICKIDDKAITYQDLLDMDLRDALKLQQLASNLLSSPMQAP